MTELMTFSVGNRLFIVCFCFFFIVFCLVFLIDYILEER